MMIPQKHATTFFFTLLLIAFASGSFAQRVSEYTSTLLEASLYSRGAELHHQVKQVQIPKGNSEIVLNQIAQNVDPQSIRVASSAGQLTILSVSFERDYLNKGTNKSSVFLEIKKKEDSARSVLKEISIQRAAEESTLALLEENRKIGGQSGASTSQITAMISYYRARYKELATSISELKEREEKQKKIVDDLAQQLNEAGGIGQDAGQLVLRVQAREAIQTALDIHYFTSNVSWEPFYEVRVEDLSQPLQLVYKANVSQTTGIDWKQVRLKFESGNPKKDNNAPEISPWWLRVQAPFQMERNTLVMAKPQRVASSLVVQSEQSQDRAFIQENQLSTSFVVDLPYDIFTNGKVQSVQLQSFQLPAVYTYLSVPKLDNNAFLVGKIIDWGELNLLPGNASLLIDNKYVGTSFINPNSTNDSLSLSLGRDERIITKRDQVNQQGSKSFLGSAQKRTYTYDISIRNTRSEAIDMELKEPFPLSTDKDIEIKLEETSNAKVNQEKGELSWNLHLNPGETRKVRVSYSVKFPKDKHIVGL